MHVEDEDISDSGQTSQQQNLAMAGREEVMDGIFGFNFKTLRSIWTLFRKPSEYFEAAKTPNWLYKFTPSLALIMGITAIMMALEFFWADLDGNYISLMATSIASGGPNPEVAQDPNFRLLVAKVLKAANVIAMPIYIILLALFAWIYRAWGEKLPFIVRLRYMFALIVPASVLGFILMLLGTLASINGFIFMSFFQSIVIILIVIDTAYRGAYYGMPKGMAIGRSILLSLTFYVISLISMTIAIFAAAIMNAEKLAAFIT